nr:MAG TPA: hypothetical protein [Caudoviricetes sp.]
MPHKVPTYYFYFVKSIIAKRVVPVRVSHVVPEIHVGKPSVRPVPEITAPPVWQVLYFFITIFCFC